MKSPNMSIASDKKNKVITEINKSSIITTGKNKNNKNIVNKNMEDQWLGELDC